MTRPGLSIVVPSFNQRRFIGETLECLVNQRSVTTEELEILVIDGGSTDGSLDVIRRYAQRIAYWVSEPDRGQTHALIKGFAAASKDVLGWLCSDDLLEPYTVREALDIFNVRPEVGFVYGDGCWIDPSGGLVKWKKEIPFHWFLWLHDHNYIPQPATFWRRKLYDAVGGLDEGFDLAMDGDLWARFAQVSRPLHVRRLWARMRLYPEQKNQRLRARSDQEDETIRQRLGVAYRTRGHRWLCHAAAKSCRVAWKLSTGCYWQFGGNPSPNPHPSRPPMETRA